MFITLASIYVLVAVNVTTGLKGDKNRAWIFTSVGYMAAAWALMFAAIHFYWTVGGSGFFVSFESNELVASDPQVFVIGNALVSTLFVILGMLPLALLFTRSKPSSTASVLHTVLRITTWMVGIGMIIYGLTGILNVLTLVGIIGDPFGRPIEVIQTNLFVWTPVWLLGGLLFTATAWYDQRRSRDLKERGVIGNNATKP